MPGLYDQGLDLGYSSRMATYQNWLNQVAGWQPPTQIEGADPNASFQDTQTAWWNRLMADTKGYGLMNPIYEAALRNRMTQGWSQALLSSGVNAPSGTAPSYGDLTKQWIGNYQNYGTAPAQQNMVNSLLSNLSQGFSVRGSNPNDPLAQLYAYYSSGPGQQWLANILGSTIASGPMAGYQQRRMEDLISQGAQESGRNPALDWIDWVISRGGAPLGLRYSPPMGNTGSQQPRIPL